MYKCEWWIILVVLSKSTKPPYILLAMTEGGYALSNNVVLRVDGENNNVIAS